jgi:hypothetical protein
MPFETQLRHLPRGEEDNVFSAALPALFNFCCVSKDNGLRLGAKSLHSPLSQIGRDKWLAWAFPRSCSSKPDYAFTQLADEQTVCFMAST